jgi:hypothetical protein
MKDSRKQAFFWVLCATVAVLSQVSDAMAQCKRDMTAQAEVTYKLVIEGGHQTLPKTLKAPDKFTAEGKHGDSLYCNPNTARERACRAANKKVKERYTPQALSDLVCADALKHQQNSNQVVQVELVSARSFCENSKGVGDNDDLPFEKKLVKCTNAAVAQVCQQELTKEAEYVRKRALRFADAIQKQQLSNAQEAWKELTWSQEVFLKDSGKFKQCLK